MCEMIKVESSNIVSVGWENETLYVEYKSGTYAYDKVDREVFLGLLGSKSRGGFMNENVKGKFAYRKL